MQNAITILQTAKQLKNPSKYPHALQPTKREWHSLKKKKRSKYSAGLS